MDSIRTALIAEAHAELAEFSQYDGYFADWQVAEVTYPILSKWGDRMAEVGDLILVEPIGRMSWVNPGTTVYLPARKHWSGRGTCTRVMGGVRRIGS